MISVIIPVYNTEKYVQESLESIINQTYSDLEIIIVDDGSTDSSLSICEQIASKDKRIKVLHKANGGVSSARNLGIDMASGELIAFADSDDILKPELFETLFNILKKYSVDRVCGGYIHFYNDGHEVYKKAHIPDGYYTTEQILPNMIDDGTLSGFMFSGVYNCLYRKDILDEYKIRFQEGIKYNEDGLFSFEYALHSKNMYSVRSLPLYKYRQHSESSTRKRPKGDKYASLHNYLDKLDFDKNRIDYYTQMKRRCVTIALWDIMDIARSEKMAVAIPQIRKELIKIHKNGDIDIIDSNCLNRYKKVYFYLMKWNLPITLFLVTKYITPRLTKKLSR